ncbi:D-glycero-alpha-D-manno-heptose-1,7-bisphosphate 7-phosphatase [Uliginosibacterium gangwonense]|uniref:D-glycero-alpha-D-manno-heptose-1,7-bisphosphate 7-phosphatase n=1 Tax=Uliginosibacterium gangwonense TaxID=392736 RepID=UPI00037FD47E|nr:HAD family hydrolase [Uliginosibacterium gangwonense]
MKPKQKALFLDRDGVINHDFAYVHRPDQFEFMEGIFALCQQATKHDYLLIVVTNQAGIGRGYYSEEQFLALTAWMKDQFTSHGTPLAEVYYCPSHPEHGLGDYRVDSPDRKPNPGMILKAQHQFNIDLACSILIGDNESDTEAALRAGVGTRLIYAPSGDCSSLPANATAIITHLHDALDYLQANLALTK